MCCPVGKPALCKCGKYGGVHGTRCAIRVHRCRIVGRCLRARPACGKAQHYRRAACFRKKRLLHDLVSYLCATLRAPRGDPLEQITDTRSGFRVVRSGRVYDPAELFASVRGRMGPASAQEADWWKGNLRLGR